MRVALFHNRYIAPGGEDVVCAAEADLLRAHGHDVAEYVVSNERIAHMSRLRVAANTLWSSDERAAVKRVLREFEPEVAHFHNTFPLLSPAVYSACREHDVPVVQTVHNYRLVCPGSTMFRDGRVCSDCLRRTVAWPSVLHGCYRESRQQTAVVAAMLALHRGLGTFHKHVDFFITLTDFARRQMVESGLDRERVVVKPNFVLSDPGIGDHRDGFALYVGRLAEEKGVRVLCEAWRRLSSPPELRIIGEGPLEEHVRSIARDLPSIRYLGRQDAAAVMEQMQAAQSLIVPSLWFEGFPMVIAEAFSTGLPVIASNLGSLASLVQHRETGFLFEPNDAGSLADAVDWAWSNSAAMDMMSAVARSEYQEKYSAETNLTMLIEIYERALERRLVRNESSPA